MTLWGGRFAAGPSQAAWDYTTDSSDRRLLLIDIEGSRAHAEMLGRTGTIDADQAKRIVEGLDRLKREAEEGGFAFEEGDEDVHSAVERRLYQLIGEDAGRLHTGRSRNDQVALDLRLYVVRAAGDRAEQLRAHALGLADLAETHQRTVIPTYTHLQQAQTTTLGHHLLAYAWMAVRDRDRLLDGARRANQSPLGSSASAGSSLPLDREAVASALGMSGPMPNSLDAVASRDFVAEHVFSCAQAMIHLSRLAEEIVLWSSLEFGWVSLSDEVSTGSSALPHKRNPDIAELVRARSSRAIGLVGSILSLQKALPLAYNRDLQEDKRIVFEADDVLASSLAATGALLDGIEWSPPAPGASTVALDLAETLVRRGAPFREAHEAVGRLIAALESEGRTLADADGGDLVRAHSSFEEGDAPMLDPATSLDNRAADGSGSPASVADQVSLIRAMLSGS